MDEHVDELIPAHALAALTPDEAARVESHVAECSACMARLKEAESTTALLALATPQVAPPPELRDRLMAAIDPSRCPNPHPSPSRKRSAVSTAHRAGGHGLRGSPPRCWRWS